MTINCLDISPLNFDGSITATADLDLAYDSDLLSEYGDQLLNELNRLEEAEVVTPDISVSGTTHQLHVWEIDDADGSLSKWSRGTSDSVSGLREAMDAEIVVVAVPPGVLVPTQPAPAGPPAPGTKQKKIRVKIIKQGGLPF
jgi:hypothetical protein